MIISRISISKIILDLINRQVDALSRSLSLSFPNKDLAGARDLSLVPSASSVADRKVCLVRS